MDSELISLYYGEDVPEEDASVLTAEIEELYPELDVDTHFEKHSFIIMSWLSNRNNINTWRIYSSGRKFSREKAGVTAGRSMNEFTNISTLKGMAKKPAQLFGKLEIYTIGDLLKYFPRSYDVYEDPIPIKEVEEGHVVTVSGAVFRRGAVRWKSTIRYLVKILPEQFRLYGFVCPLRHTFSGRMPVILRGRAVNKRGRLILEHPEIFQPPSSYENKKDTLQPVYPLTNGITNHTIMKAVRQALEQIDLQPEFLPEEIRKKYQLAEYNYALKGIHFPLSKENYYHARERFVFEEFFLFVMALRHLKAEESRAENTLQIQKKKKLRLLSKNFLMS